MDWIDLAQNRESSWALVNAIMTFGFHKIQEISRLAENRLAYQEGLCSVECMSE